MVGAVRVRKLPNPAQLGTPNPAQRKLQRLTITNERYGSELADCSRTGELCGVLSYLLPLLSKPPLTRREREE